MSEELTDPQWRAKIKSRVNMKRAEDLVRECSNKITPQDIPVFISRVFETEQSLKLFVQTLLAMDMAEAASGNLDQHRPFVESAMRIAYVYCNQDQGPSKLDLKQEG